jgi:hypothetical protein
VKSQIKQVTPVVVFQPVILEIQIESLEELKILRALAGADTSVARALTEANYMKAISTNTISGLLLKTFNPLLDYYESI